jgi:hypothetical protein
MAERMTGRELVDFCRSKLGTAYVYGMKGERMTEANFNYLHKLYGRNYVPYSDHAKIGKVCVDCSGLITWACGKTYNSAGWKSAADEKHPIATLGEAPIGALVWMPGHIGVYTGKKNGVCHYIAADGSKYGVREVPISQNDFSHWLLVRDVFDYEEDNEMVEKDRIIVDGKEYMVEMIRKDGTTYIRTRDIAKVLGLGVSAQGKVPVLMTE